MGILISKNDASMNVYDVPYYFSNEFEFGYEQGFNLAFSFTNPLLPSPLDASFAHFEVFLVNIDPD